MGVAGSAESLSADWPLFGGSFVIEGIDVLWPKRATERLVGPGTIDAARVGAIHGALATAFPVA